jgi:hypothetical protein
VSRIQQLLAVSVSHQKKQKAQSFEDRAQLLPTKPFQLYLMGES